ncbi:MAG: hypothetical protein NDI69_04490 [Bacteriovoracaceae bacterium]|nr:hypothetical protein [Bacteriovoracaceae bacterium]
MNVLRLKKMTPFLLFLSLLNLFVACGSDDDDDGSSVAPPPPQSEEQQEDQGTYQAILTPLNVTAAGSSQIEAEIRIRGDEVDAEVDANNTPANIIHRQYVYSGRSCPTPVNDSNQDGYIDYIEALSSADQILIPLDNDLTSQAAGGVYPVANGFGNYDYDEETSLARMLADLRVVDTVSTDDIMKLDPSENLNLAGRIVMVHGVSSFKILPDSVASRDNAPSHRTLPIACGVLIRVADSEEVPVPVPVPVPTPTPEPECPAQTAFNTRLSNNLLIRGVKCTGGETTEVINNDGTVRVFVCRPGQWLVTVDNINTCSPAGGCTEIGVAPVISVLERTSGSNPPEQCHYEMEPISPVTPDQRQIMDHHEVIFYDDRDPQVIREDDD